MKKKIFITVILSILLYGCEWNKSCIDDREELDCKFFIDDIVNITGFNKKGRVVDYIYGCNNCDVIVRHRAEDGSILYDHFYEQELSIYERDDY